MTDLTTTFIMSDPENEEETVLVRVSGRMTSRGHNGYFNSVEGHGEPPCDNEYEDEDWEFVDVDDNWVKMPKTMTERLMAISGNADSLQEAFDEELTHV